jgi:hypothetical protein
MPVHKVCVPYVITLVDWAPIFEWYIARLLIKLGHQNDTCYTEIGLCAQNTNTVLGSVGNTIDVIYVIA